LNIIIIIYSWWAGNSRENNAMGRGREQGVLAAKQPVFERAAAEGQASAASLGGKKAGHWGGAGCRDGGGGGVQIHTHTLKRYAKLACSEWEGGGCGRGKLWEQRRGGVEEWS